MREEVKTLEYRMKVNVKIRYETRIMEGESVIVV